MASQSSSKALLVPVGDDSIPMATTFEEQINLIFLPTPPQFIKQRPGRGGMVFDYVEANYIFQRLNAIFRCDWDVDIIEQNIYEKVGQIATKACLTVRFADGRVVKKTAWGGSDIKNKDGKAIDIADDLKASLSDSIKKASSMLGLAWDVYSGMTNGDGKAAKESEEEVKDAEVVEEPKEGQDISDMASNPDKDAVEKKVIAKCIREHLEKSTIDYKAFKTYLHVTEFKPPRQFTGKQFGNISLSEGNVEDLRFLQKNIDKLISIYIDSMKGGDEQGASE